MASTQAIALHGGQSLCSIAPCGGGAARKHPNPPLLSARASHATSNFSQRRSHPSLHFSNRSSSFHSGATPQLHAHGLKALSGRDLASRSHFQALGLIPLRLYSKDPKASSWVSPRCSAGQQDASASPASSGPELTSAGGASSGEAGGNGQQRKSVSALSLIHDLWMEGVVRPLNNFGIGSKSLKEGGVGLFMASGIFLFAIIISWVQGSRVRAQTSRYQAVFEFGQACGIAVGTPVRIRGVEVGSVVGVRPSLEKIDAVVEIFDDKIIIPRNSLVEVNQSGLISETLIDVTPQLPMPEPTVGPLNPKCAEEGLIVCDREKIRGTQGVSLDELVGICTKLAKEMDSQGVGTVFDALDKFAALAEEAKPLVEKVNAMASDVSPLLSEIKDGELLKNLEKLTAVALEAADDLKQLNSSMSNGENSHLLKESVSALTKTLKHIESISADVSTLTGDPNTRSHLKQLIESLSRIVSD